MTIGERIKKYRKAQGLTQKQLAEKMHVVRSAVTRYETRGESVTLDTLERVADALSVPLIWLIDDGDWVQITMCKDCKYWRGSTDHTCRHSAGGKFPMMPNDFCSYGRRAE